MTELAYLASPSQTETDAQLSTVEDEAGAMSLVLDRTPFYPQGGGQPSDTGVIEGDGFVFEVRKASLQEGIVHHHGVPVQGNPAPGPVHAKIDVDRRALHARLHTGGHLIMTAMYELTGLRAVKGYHFPEGPYVEFDGTLDETARDGLIERLQQRIDEMVAVDTPVLVESTSVSELKAAGVFIPGEIPADKPTRVVTTFGYKSPCGGTHVGNSGELAGLRIRKIKSKSGRTRVSYELDS